MDRNRTHRPKGSLALASPLMELSAGRRESLVPSAASRVVRPAIQTLEERCLLAGGASSALVPTLIKDIFPGTGGSTPSSLTNVGGVIFFAATDATHGRELWRSDGTPAGTVLWSDIFPGNVFPAGVTPNSSSPSRLTNVGGTLFFVPFIDYPDSRPLEGQLWKSDGATGAVQEVKHVNTGLPPNTIYLGFNPSWLTNVGGTLYFQGTDVDNGVQLWRSDGKSAGTVRLTGFGTSTLLTSPSQLTEVGGALFFSDGRGDDSNQLWKSDGTSEGTVMVKSLSPGSRFSSSSNFTNVNGTLFFQSDEELWKSDGTAAGTVLVKDLRPGPLASFVDYLTNVGGTLFFSATGADGGDELWKSDGTSAGTVLVKDINPGASGSSPRYLTNIDGTLYFSAFDDIHGRELWKSDGTSAGTDLVKDISPGATDSKPRSLTNVSGTVYFSAGDITSYGYELWKSDGTSEGTVMVGDLNPGASSSSPIELTNVGGTLFFRATADFTGSELWALVPDRTPPSATITSQPPAISNSTTFSFSFSGTDDGTLSGDLTFQVSLDGGPFAAATSPATSNGLVEGAHTFRVEAIDVAGNVGAPATYTWIVDTTAPAVTAPDDVTAEATGAAGAAVAFAPATATDAVTASPAVAYFDGLTEVHSGDLFSLGMHTIVVRATDDVSNVGTASFSISVVDTTAPVLTPPSNVTTEATTASGATVSFGPAIATDAVTPSPNIAYSDNGHLVHSGGLFAIGTHTLLVTATDDAGNVGSARFTITVAPQAPVNRATTTTLATTPDPSTVGLPVTLTATVATLSGQAMPTGTVTFTIDGQAQAPVPLQAVGSLAQATLTVSTLAAGPHAIAASYGGAPGFDPSAAGPMTQTVRHSSTITLSAIPGNASTLGQAVTLTAVVTGDGPGLPTGQVTFQDGDRLLATVPLAGSDSNTIRRVSNGRTATASFAVVLPPGRHVLSATYSGSADYAASGVTTVYQASGTTSPLDGPRVVGVSRFGYHAQPTTLMLRFDGPLAPLPASDPANYRIITIGGPGRGGQRRGRVIPIASVDYHAGSSTLLIHPAARLDVHNTYRLVVTGAAPTGLSDASGRPLDGQGTGRPGSDFVTAITRKTLVKAVPARAVDALVASGNLPAISHAAFRRRADWQWKELSFLRVIHEGKERVMGDRLDPAGPRSQGTRSR